MSGVHYKLSCIFWINDHLHAIARLLSKKHIYLE